MEALSVGKKIEAVRWSCLDNNLYAFHSQGYFSWGVSSLYKNRVDNSLVFPFEMKGVEIDHHDFIVVWSKHKIIKIRDN